VLAVQNANVVKITDFGLAKLLDSKEDAFKAAGGKVGDYICVSYATVVRAVKQSVKNSLFRINGFFSLLLFEGAILVLEYLLASNQLWQLLL